VSTPTTVIGIDRGSSSVKVVLTDPTGAVLAQTSASYPVNRPHEGWAETNPEDWWWAVRTAVVQVLTTHPGTLPSGIGLSGHMHGVVLCSAEGTPVRPAVLWADAPAPRLNWN
jgi:xylulokinase